jgi:hypothetical protein
LGVPESGLEGEMAYQSDAALGFELSKPNKTAQVVSMKTA